MKKVKVILDRKAFLRWRFACAEDLEALGEVIVEKLKKKLTPKITLIEIAEMTGYIPLHLVLNKGNLPRDIIDKDYEEIERVDLCNFVFVN